MVNHACDCEGKRRMALPLNMYDGAFYCDTCGYLLKPDDYRLHVRPVRLSIDYQLVIQGDVECQHRQAMKFLR